MTRDDVLTLYDRMADEFGSLEHATIEVDKSLCKKSLAAFVKRAWHVIEPGQPYIHGWHIDYLATHLEAITDGLVLDNGDAYNRLMINVPPGSMKSLLIGVFWPAWEWGPRNMPHLRYVCASHSLDLAIRDGLRMRRLISSEWYQARWGDRVQLTGDQNAKTRYENTATGFRQAAAAGSITGSRGDRVIIDDPLSVDGGNSEAILASTATWFLEAVPTRLNNPATSAIVLVMQRLSEGDTTGIILDKGLAGWDHLMLPMEYDPTRAAPSLLGVEDPRQEDGELLFPARFSREVVERDKKIMGPYATAGQYQQMPAPRGGGVIKRDWWQLWEGEAFPPFDFVVASLDTAYTMKQENDPSAMTVWGVFSGDVTPMMANNFVSRSSKLRNAETEAARFDETTRVVSLLHSNPESTPRIMLMYSWAERLELPGLIEKVAKTCKRMKVDHLLIENKAAGISVGQELRRLYGHEDWGVQLVNPGAIDKLARLYAVQHIFSEGIVFAPDLKWADQVIAQCEVFPKGKHDDLVDTTSMALKYLRETGILVRQPERISEIDAGRRHRGKPLEPLYSV